MATNLKFKEQKRNEVLNLLKDFLKKLEEDVMQTGTNEISFPCVLDNGDDETIQIKVSIPTGTRGRNGETEPFDPYTAHEDFMQKMRDKKEKAEKRAKEKEEKKKRDEKLRQKLKEQREKAKAEKGK